MTIKTQAIEAAISGLDFYIRNQIKNTGSADCGRYPLTYNIDAEESVDFSTNWETAVLVESMLAGYQATKRKEYLDSAAIAVNYIKSLQAFLPYMPRLNGVFREITPQTQWAHPRDALTAAWALLDWYAFSNDDDSLKRVLLFADWFINVAMERGYPYWTVRFDNQSWDPAFWGSFHSGGAFFFYRLYQITKEQNYLTVVRKILDFYNKNHIDSDGNITVALDCRDMSSLDDKGINTHWWEEMHKYNDDFGTLANMAAYKITHEKSYLQAASKFLKKMQNVQRDDGGFGPDTYSVPSASGVIAIESICAQYLGLDLMPSEIIDKAINHILTIQVKKKDSPGNGAFLDSEQLSNARTGAYSIMALIRYAEFIDTHYFIKDK